MEKFVRCQNVERYCRLLERVTDEIDRQKIHELLAEAQQKHRGRRRSARAYLGLSSLKEPGMEVVLDRNALVLQSHPALQPSLGRMPC